jgi:hypothetical protein
VLLRAAGASAPPINIDREDDILALVERVDLPEALRVVSALEHTQDLIDRNVNTRLATEVLLLDLPRIP